MSRLRQTNRQTETDLVGNKQPLKTAGVRVHLVQLILGQFSGGIAFGVLAPPLRVPVRTPHRSHTPQKSTRRPCAQVNKHQRAARHHTRPHQRHHTSQHSHHCRPSASTSHKSTRYSTKHHTTHPADTTQLHTRRKDTTQVNTGQHRVDAPRVRVPCQHVRCRVVPWCTRVGRDSIAH
jgi:hypothetical protein